MTNRTKTISAVSTSEQNCIKKLTSTLVLEAKKTKINNFKKKNTKTKNGARTYFEELSYYTSLYFSITFGLIVLVYR